MDKHLSDDYKIRRKKDEKGEKVIADYLDRYFYPQWVTTITRNHDDDTQKAGKDLTVTDTKGINYVIDEKAAICYANKPLKTFANEITSINTIGKEYRGWLLSHTINDYYVYVWIPQCKTTGEVKSVEDIIEVDVALVKKQDLYNWFNEKKITGSKLLKVSDELRRVTKMGIDDWWHYVSNCTNQSVNTNGYKYHINNGTQENSVNILISKDILMNTIASYSVNIKNGKLKEIRKKVL